MSSEFLREAILDLLRGRTKLVVKGTVGNTNLATTPVNLEFRLEKVKE